MSEFGLTLIPYSMAYLLHIITQKLVATAKIGI